MQRYNPIDNENGFVLVVALLMLVVLTIMGLSASTTTQIELQISGNERVAKDLFYKAEAAAYEAAQLLENENVQNLKDRKLGGVSGNGLVTEGEL